ncbi:lipid asymmetry maintenance protein MlaB [Vibrio sp. SA48]
MSHSQWQPLSSQSVVLSGALDREYVPDLWKFIKQWAPTGSTLDVELKQVERIDSAGMVMLIHLIEHAKKRNCHIMLSFVPEQLRTLFQLSNVESLIAQHIKN